MLVSDLITEKNLIPDLTAKDRSEAHHIMVEHLVKQRLISSSLKDQCLHALQAREDKMTTAMGGGFALPHASVAKLPALCTLLARAPQGIACEAVDNKPVTLFFLILVPADQNQIHLQTLATVAKFFNRKGIKSKLLQAAGAPEILTLLRAP